MGNLHGCWHHFHCRIFSDFRHGFSPSENDCGGLTVFPIPTLYKGGLVSAGTDGKPIGRQIPRLDRERVSREGFPGRSIPERSRERESAFPVIIPAKTGRENYCFDCVGIGKFFASTGTRPDYSGMHRFPPEKIRSNRIRRPGTFSGSRAVRAGLVPMGRILGPDRGRPHPHTLILRMAGTQRSPLTNRVSKSITGEYP
jgi:hypothetical protein